MTNDRAPPTPVLRGKSGCAIEASMKSRRQYPWSGRKGDLLLQCLSKALLRLGEFTGPLIELPLEIDRRRTTTARGASAHVI